MADNNTLDLVKTAVRLNGLTEWQSPRRVNQVVLKLDSIKRTTLGQPAAFNKKYRRDNSTLGMVATKEGKKRKWLRDGGMTTDNKVEENGVYIVNISGENLDQSVIYNQALATQQSMVVPQVTLRGTEDTDSDLNEIEISDAEERSENMSKTAIQLIPARPETMLSILEKEDLPILNIEPELEECGVEGDRRLDSPIIVPLQPTSLNISIQQCDPSCLLPANVSRDSRSDDLLFVNEKKLPRVRKHSSSPVIANRVPDVLPPISPVSSAKLSTVKLSAEEILNGQMSDELTRTNELARVKPRITALPPLRQRRNSRPLNRVQRLEAANLEIEQGNDLFVVRGRPLSGRY